MLIPTILMHKHVSRHSGIGIAGDPLSHLSHITIRQHMYTNILVINNNTIVNYIHTYEQRK